MAFNNSSHIPACITFVGSGVTAGDGMILSVGVGGFVGDVPAHAVSKMMEGNNREIGLILNACLI